ncbi:hypothetical protein V1522DRAFT_407031 [Lipomyces starkeyi]
MTSPMAPIDDEQASYRRALNFLTANEPERRLDICLSYRTFQALEKPAHVLYGDAKYPRVEYDSSGSRLTIYTAPSALHGASAAALQQGIVNSVRDGLIRHHKQELFRYIQPIGESTYNSVDEQGGGSKKPPMAGSSITKMGAQHWSSLLRLGSQRGTGN